MNVTFACPDCQRATRLDLPPREISTGGDSIARSDLVCSHCGLVLPHPAGAIEQGQLLRCLACPSRELFVRKDFPQRLGVAIVVLGFAASCVAWYFYWTNLTFAILFATALADLVLYKIVGEALVCYSCGAEYRQVAEPRRHGGFDLETHERYRQQAARLAASSGDPRPRVQAASQSLGGQSSRKI
ncbi:MAG: hypothetical protein WD278_00225 [Pirellulales bacterium]